MTMKLFLQALLKFTAGVILLPLLLFVPAGTWKWKEAWILCGILFVPMFLAGIVMMIKNPGLLEKRLNMKEKENDQKEVIASSGLMFLASFITAGLCYRRQLMILPFWVCIAASVIFLASYAMFAEVLRENTWLSRTVEVVEGQKVVDTGLYGIVRHPMYSATLFLFLSMPLVLRSLPAFVIMLGYLPIIQKRMDNEEKVLEEGLEGYREYKQKVRYRVIPYIW